MLTICILEFIYLNRTQFILIYRKNKCANVGVLSRNAHSDPLAAGLTMFWNIEVIQYFVYLHNKLLWNVYYIWSGCKHKRTSCASLNDGLRWSPSNLVRNCMFLTCWGYWRWEAAWEVLPLWHRHRRSGVFLLFSRSPPHTHHLFCLTGLLASGLLLIQALWTFSVGPTYHVMVIQCF